VKPAEHELRCCDLAPERVSGVFLRSIWPAAPRKGVFFVLWSRDELKDWEPAIRARVAGAKQLDCDSGSCWQSGWPIAGVLVADSLRHPLQNKE
jgi:hypothetical protein